MRRLGYLLFSINGDSRFHKSQVRLGISLFRTPAITAFAQLKVGGLGLSQQGERIPATRQVSTGRSPLPLRQPLGNKSLQCHKPPPSPKCLCTLQVGGYILGSLLPLVALCEAGYMSRQI